MSKTIIIVEGKDDVELIQQVVESTGIAIASIEIKPAGGWTKLKGLAESLLARQENGERILIVVDADCAGKDYGGYDARIAEINNILNTAASRRIDAQIFLVPNNQKDGDLETLLENMVLCDDENNKFIACWERYSRCIELNFRKTPARKTKINEYRAALSGKNYDALFDFASPALEPLKEFLRQNLAT